MADWTDEKIKKLRQAWDEGLSATQIVIRFNYEYSRNAILGKVNRLGLKSRKGGRVANQLDPPVAKRRTRLVRNTSSKPLPPPPPPPPKKRIRNLLPREFNDDAFFYAWLETLSPRQRNIYRIPRDRHCKYIIGEVSRPTSYWCNKDADGSWCPFHKSLVYVPPETYRRNKR